MLGSTTCLELPQNDQSSDTVGIVFSSSFISCAENSNNKCFTIRLKCTLDDFVEAYSAALVFAS